MKRLFGGGTCSSTASLPLFSTASLPLFSTASLLLVSVSVSLRLFESSRVSALSVATGLVGVYAGELGGDAVVVGDGGWLIIVESEAAGAESEVVDS